MEILFDAISKVKSVDLTKASSVMNTVSRIARENPFHFCEALSDTFGVFSRKGAMCKVYDAGNFVIKVWERDRCYEDFLDFLKSKEADKYRKHLPKIYHYAEVAGSKLVIMKKYKEQKEAERVCLCDMQPCWNDLEEDFVTPVYELIRNTQKKDLLFRELVLKLYRSHEVLSWDLHDDNILIDRKGNLIIIDPLN